MFYLDTQNNSPDTTDTNSNDIIDDDSLLSDDSKCIQ
jgi:hypothetical protein